MHVGLQLRLADSDKVRLSRSRNEVNPKFGLLCSHVHWSFIHSRSACLFSHSCITSGEVVWDRVVLVCLSAVPSCPSSNDFPGKPFDLRWSVYTFNDSSRCVPVLNITWRLPQDGNSNLLTVFLHVPTCWCTVSSFVFLFSFRTK